MADSGRRKKKQTLSSSSIQFGGQGAFGLVGGLVEKGFGAPNAPPSVPPPPRPTVLPFPVARHRSHGPHWGPLRGDGGNYSEDVEEEGLSGYERIASFAQPMLRKEKKSLDFSCIRSGAVNADTSGAQKGEKSQNFGESKKAKNSEVTTRGSDRSDLSDFPVVDNMRQLAMPVCNDGKDLGVEEMDYSVGELVKEADSDMVIDGGNDSGRVHDSASGFVPSRLLNEDGGMSLESQIDAENRDLLGRMSSDEIAEAHAEIMAKVNPELIDRFRKRGQDKLKRKNGSASDMPATGEVGRQFESLLTDPSAVPRGVASKDLQRDIGDAGRNTMGGSLWDSWSRRVESVREIRFSVDADVMKREFPHGTASVRSEHNVAERDLLRTEGDPGANGYTIKEALALARSVFPAQRTIALHLIADILDRAIQGINEKKVGCTLEVVKDDGVIDWEAIWAFALGPEPELALVLRICLDDNHSSVVVACARVIQCVLSFDLNERFFNTSEKLSCIQDDAYTAAVFRSKPELDVGFLQGGFWKYSAKPSNLLPSANDVDDQDENEPTIQDDVVVASQDIAAGLIRMGLLERISYLLENEQSTTLEDCLLSILIAIARHSPTSATAVLNCSWLVRTIVDRFMSKEMKISPSKIKSVILLKVLAKVDKKTCLELIKNGTFQKVAWHLMQYLSLDQWLMCGRDACKLSSALLVEQLRLWKVCIEYGHCVQHFMDAFPGLIMWLSVPDFEKLIRNDVLCEFAAVSTEAYLILEAMTKRLPSFYSHLHPTVAVSDEEESWSWTRVGPLIDLALCWTEVKDNFTISSFFDRLKEENESVDSLLWLISSVLHTVSGVLKAVLPADLSENRNGSLPWLPDFVPKIGLRLIKNRYFTKHDSFLQFLGHLRYKSGLQTSIACVSCLQALLQVAISVDTLIQSANREKDNLSPQYSNMSSQDKILADGLVESCLADLRSLLINSQPSKLSIETFGRGGPAPGVGVGWGASGGGFWSTTVLLAQMDMRLATCMLEVLRNSSAKGSWTTEMINSALEVCLAAGPPDRSVVDKLLEFLCCVSVLKSFETGIHEYLLDTEGLEPFHWKYEEEDYELFSAVLASHFKERWLSVKTKSKGAEKSQNGVKKGNTPLETIYEESEGSSGLNEGNATSLTLEWAHQRLPLPVHWFLSPISIMQNKKATSLEAVEALLKLARGGLFFLLCLESTYVSPVQNVSVVWKLHALSTILIDNMAVLEDQKSRDVYEILQNLYGLVIDGVGNGPLLFQSEVHANYSTLLEMLVEQFAGASYGDLLFGRQVCVYLHRRVEASVKLATWNALFNARALDLLPPVEDCLGKAEGYLEPVEDNEKVLEAYSKSWISGALDKAAMRKSASYTLALHHLSSFIFADCTGDKLSLRNQLVKSLLRDYSRKMQHEGMMVDLVQYEKPGSDEGCVVEERLQVLKDACEGNSSFLKEVEKLKEQSLRR